MLTNCSTFKKKLVRKSTEDNLPNFAVHAEENKREHSQKRSTTHMNALMINLKNPLNFLKIIIVNDRNTRKMFPNRAVNSFLFNFDDDNPSLNLFHHKTIQFVNTKNKNHIFLN